MKFIIKRRYTILSNILRYSFVLILGFSVFLSTYTINNYKNNAIAAVPVSSGVTVTGFTPTSGKFGDIITITGTGFNGVTGVYFGQIAKSTPSKTSNENTITVEVPRVAVTGIIYVETDHGEGASAEDFTVIPTSTTGTCTNGATDYPTCTPPRNNNSNNQNNNNHTTGEIVFKGLVPVCNSGEIDPTTKNYVNKCDFNMVVTLINKIISFVLITLATPLFVLIIIYVAWLYLSAGGNADNINKAKKIIKNAIIGYVIALAAWLIVKTIIVTSGFTGDTFLS